MAQIVSYRLYASRFKQRAYKIAVLAWFLLINALWLITAYKLSHREPLSGNFLSLVARPSIAWQSVHLLVVLPVGAAIAVVWYAIALVRKVVKRVRWEEEEVDDPGLAYDAENEAEGDGEDDRPEDGFDGEDGEDGVGGGEAESGDTPQAVPVGYPGTQPEQPQRRDFLRLAGTVGLGGMLAFTAYALVRQSVSPSIKHLPLKIQGLPRELHGFTIAHLTDIHLGLWSSKEELDLALAEAQKAKPDIVIFTGDMVDRDANYARQYAEPVAKRLDKIPYGTYCVLGNHDHFTNPSMIAQILGGMGIRVLRERRATVGNLPLHLTGLDDQGAFGHSFNRRRDITDDSEDVLDFGMLTGPMPNEGDFQILLNHRPEGFRQAMKEGYGLYLVGHTHGGQYSVPGFPRTNLAKLVYKYTAGLYHEHGGYLNVSCGLASVGIPFRLGSWPEFSLITLERA
jgi:predicted MPP superfamily phosphohydrolase